MINSLCGSMGSIKAESLPHVQSSRPSSPNETSVSESKKSASASASCDLEQNPVTPRTLGLPGRKYDNLEGEGEGEGEAQSPENSIWESFFSDNLESDFMICSPVRNVPSPQTSMYNYNYNYANAMQGQSVSGCSPPRFSSQAGSYSSSLKGKGLSPLQKVCNSPNNQYQYMQSMEGLSLPAIEEFLEDYHKDGLEEEFSSPKMSDIGSSDSFDIPTRIPALLDNIMMSYSSKFSGSRSEKSASSHGNDRSQLSQERDVDHDPAVGSIRSRVSFSEVLRQERLKEKMPRKPQQQQQLHPQEHKTLGQSLMIPLSMETEQEQDSGLQLVHLLLACAETVAKEDYMLARRYLHHLNRVVTPLGDSMQRVASCFTEALSARLAATLATKPSNIPKPPFSPFLPNSLEILKIYQILYQACPYVKFAHFTANQAIFEAFEAEERVHVIDLDILQGYQWPAFMQALAARPGGAPFLRITGIGPSVESVKETGRCLTELAHSLHVPFEFHPIGEQLEDLKPHMFQRRVGEALAVNSINRLHRITGNSLGIFLAMIRDQAPKIFTLVEKEASHNGPYFLGRFLEALHYYSAIFDSLDATFPPDSAQRTKVEQYIFAPEIMNIVACEGAERIERHERLEKWRKIMEGKGFQGVPLSANAVTQSKILLGLYSCDGYKLTEDKDKGCLLLGWQDRAILAASAWRC